MRNAVVIDTDITNRALGSAEIEVLTVHALSDSVTALGRQDSNLQLRRNTGNSATEFLDERPAFPSENPSVAARVPDKSGYEPVTNRQFPGDASKTAREARCTRCDDDIRLPHDDLCASCRREIDETYAELPGAEG